MSGSCGSHEGVALGTPLSSARARAILLLPELEHYRWQDDYFDSRCNVDIMAVIDHNDVELKLARRCCGLMAVIFLAEITYFILVPLVAAAPKLTASFFGFLMLVISICMLSFWCIFKSASPHTAVTADGLIHIKGRGFAYGFGEEFFFPFEDINDVILEEVRGENSISYQTVIQLAGPLASYQQSSDRYTCVGSGRRIVIHALKNKTFFITLVNAMKNGRNPMGHDADATEGATFSSDLYSTAEVTHGNISSTIDEEAQELRFSIQEQLNRRNELCASARSIQ